MKKLILLIVVLMFGTMRVQAIKFTSENVAAPLNYSNSFIFMENGITFSVYPDGEFDFFIDNRVNLGVGAQVRNVGITFNSGFNYNPFVQYDDFGAVIQVENTPIFYDYYGRVSQIGGVDVRYRNGLVRQLGGLNIFYRGSVFNYTTGFINVYNRRYIARPWHRWFARPAVGFCNVWTSPYRRWYTPVRYTWHRPYRNNIRRAYAQIGHEYRYNRPRRAQIYRNDRRVSVRDNRELRNYSVRSNRNVAQNRLANRLNQSYIERNAVRSNRSVAQQSAISRSNHGLTSHNNGRRNNELRSATKRSNTDLGRSKSSRSVTQRLVTRTPNNRTVVKREVIRSPNKKIVTKQRKTTIKPNHSVSARNKKSTAVKRATTAKRSVSRSAGVRSTRRL